MISIRRTGDGFQPGLFRILNPDVSPLKSVSQIHRNGPETAKSDVSPQKQVVKIHRGCILKLNPDVSKTYIHRNPREIWHPDVSSTNKNMIVLLLKIKIKT